MCSQVTVWCCMMIGQRLTQRLQLWYCRFPEAAVCNSHQSDRWLCCGWCLPPRSPPQKEEHRFWLRGRNLAHQCEPEIRPRSVDITHAYRCLRMLQPNALMAAPAPCKPAETLGCSPTLSLTRKRADTCSNSAPWWFPGSSLLNNCSPAFLLRRNTTDKNIWLRTPHAGTGAQKWCHGTKYCKSRKRSCLAVSKQWDYAIAFSH